ncbi:MAG: hypothetical protein FWE54_02815 [Methanimicrococcus sp.]|nr:hypothetical protein [Methanimicrococcus sp.]
MVADNKNQNDTELIKSQEKNTNESNESKKPNENRVTEIFHSSKYASLIVSESFFGRNNRKRDFSEKKKEKSKIESKNK